MRPSNALRLYLLRMRARWPQELLAALGIAAGVALLLAAQVSSMSLSSSLAALEHGLAGDATLQVRARSQAGLPQGALAAVRRLPGVRIAAPLLEAQANALGPRSSDSVTLIGAPSDLSALRGALVPHSEIRPFGGFGALMLADSVAHRIGVSAFGQEVRLQIAGRTMQAPLYFRSGERQSTLLRSSPVVIAPLAFAQQLAGMPRHITRILIETRAGASALVTRALRRLAAGRWNVEPIEYEQRLFAAAATANNQSTALFASISAIVGFLFAWGAMLFTVPERRRLIVEVRREGYGDVTVAQLLGIDVLALAAAACALGLLLGDQLSTHLLRSNPAFLSLAFTLGSQRNLEWQQLLIAIGGGTLAATIAVLLPLRHVLPSRSFTRTRLARKRHRTPRRLSADSSAKLACGGLAGVLAATLILLAAPDAAIPGMALLTLALLLMLPATLQATIKGAHWLASGIIAPVPHLAAMQLRASRSQSVAVASIGALAVFAAVAIQGAHRDLLTGLDRATNGMNPSNVLWVAPSGSYDLLHTASFAPLATGTLSRVPGVSGIEPYRGGLLDYGLRRALVIAPPASSSASLLAGQLVQGSLPNVVAQLHTGNGLVLSRPLAAEHHLHVGEWLTLPTPVPTRMRLAALSSNLGWVPGTIVMSSSAYARASGNTAMSAYAITVAGHASPRKVTSAIDHALPADTGLSVQSASEHATLQRALSNQALARLSQIATVILLASVLAIATTIGAMIWQRRARIASLKLDGLRRMQLWRVILLESGLLLGAGCLAGALFGLYAQQLADRALAETIGFPVVHSLASPQALLSVVFVVGAALLALALPGYLATDVPTPQALVD